MSLLRLITAGSVDDGKSTLIGRLLYDSRNVAEDHLATAENNLAQLTDGLRAERERGITIDVAYRYFATPRRKFILADTPGHAEYTRNMATAASTADVAILLIDARLGLRSQTRRHARIATLLGVRQLVVAVNKMDLVGYDERVFDETVREFRACTSHSSTLGHGARPTLYFIPISAFRGDNVVTKSDTMPWYSGPPLLELLETADVAHGQAAAFYFPVQSVIEGGFAGRIASGAIRAGDEVIALPSNRTSRVRRIITFDGDLPRADAPHSVTLQLEDDVAIGRGGVLAATSDLPELRDDLCATLIWFDETPLQPDTTYLLKHTSHTVAARVHTPEHVRMNDIVSVRITTSEPLIVKYYADNRTAGSFILIDPLTNATVAACMACPCPNESHSPPPS